MKIWPPGRRGGGIEALGRMAECLRRGEDNHYRETSDDGSSTPIAETLSSARDLATHAVSKTRGKIDEKTHTDHHGGGGGYLCILLGALIQQGGQSVYQVSEPKPTKSQSCVRKCPSPTKRKGDEDAVHVRKKVSCLQQCMGSRFGIHIRRSPSERMGNNWLVLSDSPTVISIHGNLWIPVSVQAPVRGCSLCSAQSCGQTVLNFAWWDPRSPPMSLPPPKLTPTY